MAQPTSQSMTTAVHFAIDSEKHCVVSVECYLHTFIPHQPTNEKQLLLLQTRGLLCSRQNTLVHRIQYYLQMSLNKMLLAAHYCVAFIGSP